MNPTTVNRPRNKVEVHLPKNIKLPIPDDRSGIATVIVIVNSITTIATPKTTSLALLFMMLITNLTNSRDLDQGCCKQEWDACSTLLRLRDRDILMLPNCTLL